MPYYSITDSKLDITDTNLFDIKTKVSAFGRDLDFNSIGNVSRIIGLDKLKQQTTKIVLIKKNSYTNVKTLGTSLVNKVTDNASIVHDIKESLATYATLQQQQKPNTFLEIIGRNVYRSIDISSTSAWIKVNDHILSSNTFTDTELEPGTTYYYATTILYKDTLNKTKETNISTYQSFTAVAYDTLNAKVNSDFVLISKNKSAVLFWNTSVQLNTEEQLRSLIKAIVTKFPGDPRGLRIDLALTNRDLTQAQILNIRG